jgi:hypothetical protein
VVTVKAVKARQVKVVKAAVRPTQLGQQIHSQNRSHGSPVVKAIFLNLKPISQQIHSQNRSHGSPVVKAIFLDLKPISKPALEEELEEELEVQEDGFSMIVAGGLKGRIQEELKEDKKEELKKKLGCLPWVKEKDSAAEVLAAVVWATMTPITKTLAGRTSAVVWTQQVTQLRQQIT